MGETAGWDPGDWKGHDFGNSARDDYNRTAARTYSTAKAQKKTVADLLPKQVICEQETLFVWVDQTGSMGHKTAIIFGKAPYLDVESGSYLGEKKKIAIGAIGDARNPEETEDYPVQLREPVKGKVFREKIAEIVQEGKGGGNGKESYELALLYMLHNVRFPDSRKKTIAILTGDEGFYPTISPEIAKEYVHVTLEKTTRTEDVYKQLSPKASVYMIQFDYGGSGYSTSSIRRQWVDLLGEDRVIYLDDPERIVDVIFGILAKETQQVAYFLNEITNRQQKPGQIPAILKALEPVLGKNPGDQRLLKPGATKHAAESGKQTPRLLGDGS